MSLKKFKKWEKVGWVITIFLVLVALIFGKTNEGKAKVLSLAIGFIILELLMKKREKDRIEQERILQKEALQFQK